MYVNASIIIGMCITFAVMAAAGIYTVKKVKSSDDYTTSGRKLSPVMVAGTIVGTCVGAGATIGTAQTAFIMGIVGWWQTFGLAIGVLILGLFMSQAVYKSRVETVPQILEKKYGSKIRPITAVFSVLAIFLSILSQTMGFLPLFTSIVPASLATAAVVCVILTLAFVVLGGIFATSLGGIIKIAIILGSCLLSGIIAVVAMGGFSGMRQTFEFNPWFNMFARGASTDLAIGLGFVLGILVTQVYIQAVLSARDAKAARNGAILASLFTFPVGLFGVFVGMYMRQFFPYITPSQAFPRFMIETFNPVIAGIFIGGLMLAALGSNAGLIFGMSTMFTRDVIKRVVPSLNDKRMLVCLRVTIVIMAILAGIFAVTEAGQLIQHFIFLSFALRTTVFLVPMLFALYYKGRLTKAAGMAAVLAGPLTNIFWNLILRNIETTGSFVMRLQGWDPIYTGLAAAFIAFITANALALAVKKENITEPAA